jgi:hypothetical protein
MGLLYTDNGPTFYAFLSLLVLLSSSDPLIFIHLGSFFYFLIESGFSIWIPILIFIFNSSVENVQYSYGKRKKNITWKRLGQIQPFVMTLLVIEAKWLRY